MILYKVCLQYNQWADIWMFDEGMGKCMAQLQGHTRAISDADWSVVNPYLCATCSLDTYTYMWDVRDLKRHKFAISTVCKLLLKLIHCFSFDFKFIMFAAGSSQVKWNKINGNYLSTAHDGNIRVWDIRVCRMAVECCNVACSSHVCI